MELDSDHDFIIECTNCEMDRATDDLEDAIEFSSKHKEHTDHDLHWKHLNLDLVDELDVETEWIVSCDVCEDRWYFDTESEARDFWEEHAEFTDHAPNAPLDSEEKTLDPAGMKDIVKAFEDATKWGAPEDLVVQYSQEIGLNESTAERKMDKLKQNGEVYSPKFGYLLVT